MMAEKSITSSFSSPAGMHDEVESHRKQAVAALGGSARLLHTETGSVPNANNVPVFSLKSHWTNDPIK